MTEQASLFSSVDFLPRQAPEPEPTPEMQLTVVPDGRTYGKLVYDRSRRRWEIECEPQVCQRLKRVFHRIAKNAVSITIDDTVDNGRDLEWFLARYPMEMSAADLKILRRRAADHRGMVEDVGRILRGDYVPKAVSLALPPRNYQAVAIDLALLVKGLLVADDVGLGKTVIGIGVMARLEARPAMVVTLTHLPRQWAREIERFLPGLNVHILKSGTPYEFKDRRGVPYFPDVIVSNYHKLDRWAEELRGKVKTVIFDEAHELRRTGSQKYQAAARLAKKAEYRVGLTATPIFNYGGEIYSVLDVLKPGLLGTWEEFSTEWCSHIADRAKAHLDDPQAFGAYAREAGLMLRRTRREVGRELPALTVCPQTIDADLEYLDKIETEATALAKLVLSSTTAPFDKMRASEDLSWKLRQATGIAKAPAVAEFVRMLIENGEPVLLAGWHREVYRIWAERLADLDPRYFTGEESPAQKDAAAQDFISGRSKLLIMSLRAGAGIDGLQKACRTVVFGEIDWSPACHEQFVGRILRDGQTDPVFAYYLLADCGSDPVMADVLGVKRSQLEGLRDPTGNLTQLSQTDPDRVRKLAEAYLAQRKINPSAQ